MGLKVFYNPQQAARNVRVFSPSPGKPELVMKEWRKQKIPMQVVSSFAPATKRDFYLAHHEKMVDGILSGKLANGFGNSDEEVIRSLPWTTGSMIAATLDALKSGGITVSPTSGFHHASYIHSAAFCTFNGLAIAAMRARLAGANKVGVLDLDQHYGNGLVSIMKELDLRFIKHYTIGEHRYGPKDGMKFIKLLPRLMETMFADCDVLIYQAGADSCNQDPLGGVFSPKEMRLRDRTVFQTAMKMELPVAWNLAGGYQDKFQNVLDLHTATAEEAVQALRVAKWDSKKKLMLA